MSRVPGPRFWAAVGVLLGTWGPGWVERAHGQEFNEGHVAQGPPQLERGSPDPDAGAAVDAGAAQDPGAAVASGAAQDPGAAVASGAAQDPGAAVAPGAALDSGAARAEGAPSVRAEPPMSITVGGYVETFYQWNFAEPGNGITNYRAFDNRHNAFTLSNVALDAQFRVNQVYGRITGQVGHTPSTYYMAEPSSPGTSGANASDAELWKYLQQAFLGCRLPGRQVRVALEAGLFLSPIGVESMAIHESWNWSRSNLFFGLPFYHTGARLSVSPLHAWTLKLAVYNGWNSVVDNNEEKSVSLQTLWDISTDVTLSLLYFGGVERSPHALEGEPFRNLFDAYIRWQVVDWFALKGQGNAGFERHRFGTSAWGAGALYARFSLRELLALALRGDVFYEHVPASSRGLATPLFWPVSWVSSATATFEYTPQSYLSLRLEYRHDEAASALYYRGAVRTSGLPNSRAQDTLTVGATAWF